MPISITASASSPAGIKKISIFLEDQKLFETESDQVTFFYSHPQPDGLYILKVIAEDQNSSIIEQTKIIEYSLGRDLLLQDLTDDIVIFFPFKLKALGTQTVSGVEFFFQKENQTPVRIAGTTSAVPLESGVGVKFRLTWEGFEQPEAGTYEIFAQSNTGIRSNRVKIIIP